MMKYKIRFRIILFQICMMSVISLSGCKTTTGNSQIQTSPRTPETESAPDDDFLLDRGDPVTLKLDDDTEIECVVELVFQVNEQDYVSIILPEDAKAVTAHLYRYSFEDGGNPVLAHIDDDSEYKDARDAYYLISKEIR